MNLRDGRALVTGGTGFVGSHLVERLRRDGVSVRVLANYRSRPSIGNLEFLDPTLREAVEIVWGDITDRDSVIHAVEGANVVFHLAALIGIPYSYIAPHSYIQTNVVGTLNLLQAARAHNVQRIVHTSTSEVYGSAQYTPIDERHPIVGQSPYAASKIGADQLVESFHRSFELPTVTVRPFNVFGPRQSDRAIIPTIISQALHRPKGIAIGSPEPKRDFTFVTDTVDGFIRAAQSDRVIGRTVNVGAGRSTSIGDLAKRIAQQTGQPSIATDPQRARPTRSEVCELLCDYRLARELLEWSPKVTLDQGLAHTIEFVRENPQLFAPDRYVV